MNIVFIGMMGSGKSVIGKRVAEILGLDFIDTDNYIEKLHGKIEDIFEKQGETAFREIERAAVLEIAEKDKTVISTGGGVVLRSDNITALSKNSKVVFLKASPETLFERVKNSNRPLLRTGGLQRIRDILAKRYPLYEKYATVSVDTDCLSVDECAKKVIETLGEI